MSEPKEVIYNLKTPFNYAYKGDKRDAGFITLKAPTVSNIGYISKLKQGFMRAIRSQSQSSATSSGDASADDLTGEMIIMMLQMSDVDYSEYMTIGKCIFVDSDIALIDGELKFNKDLINRLSVDDLELMIGEYLKDFILTSALRMMQA